MTSRDNTTYYTITAAVFIGIVVCSLLFHNPGQPTNGDSERENISTIVIAAAPFITAAATVVLAFITWRYVRLTDSLLKATYRPQIVVSLYISRLSDNYNIYSKYISVENVGTGVARKLIFGGDLDFETADGIPLNQIHFFENGIDVLAPGKDRGHQVT